MLKVAIVILNWNGKDFLRRFLPSVLEHSRMDGARVIVADNGSTDGSVEVLRKDFPEADVIALDRNYGFAEGYNRALERIEAEYFLLLNSDAEVTPGWLKPLLMTMESDPLIAACMPKIKALQQPDFFEYAGAAGGFIDKYGYPFCQGRIFDSVEMDYGQYDKETEVFWTSGAGMMIRGSLFSLLGGFDPDFFAHMEEIDLCWRLKNRGYKLMLSPGSTIYHLGWGTLPQGNPRKTFLNFRNNLVLLYKNLPGKNIRIILFMRLLMDFLSAVRFLFRGSLRDVFAIARAHFAFYRRVGKYRKFRQAEKQNIKRWRHPDIYQGSIVTDYFLKKKITFKSLKWNIQRVTAK